MGHRLAGRHRLRPRGGARDRGHQGAGGGELGRTIDEDHYGAGFGFRFGSPEEPIVTRYHSFLTQRLGRRPEGYAAIGGVTEIMALFNQFREAGVHKFVLRPIASGTDDMLEQTRQLVERGPAGGGRAQPLTAWRGRKPAYNGGLEEHAWATQGPYSSPAERGASAAGSRRVFSRPVTR